MSNEPKAGKRIDPEMLAAYIDNRLPPDQRAAVEAQLATDPESYALLVDTLEALDDDEIKSLEVKDPFRQPIPFAPKASRSPFRNLVLAGGALAVAAAIVLAVMQPAFLRRYLGSDVDPRFERLVAAVGEERYVEPRLSGDFVYRGRPTELRGERGSAQSNISLLATAAAAEKVAVESPTAGNLHVWGVAQLLLGRRDDAINTLLKAAGAPGTDALLLADLSAAYLDRASTSNNDADLVSALKHADDALAVESSLRSAAFNRALALEGLGRSRDAVAAWQYFLGLDSQSGWADEARVHIRNLEGASKPIARAQR